MAFCIGYFFYFGIISWVPAFFMRAHGMNARDLGIVLGVVTGFGGLVFTFLGGFLATHFAPRKESLQMKLCGVIIGVSTLFYALCFLTSSKTLALLSISIALGVLVPLQLAPIQSAIQSLVEERMRAVALAFIFMLSNLVGLGFGPMAVGGLSDILGRWFGDQSLRFALLIFTPGTFLCAWVLFRSSVSIEKDIQLVEQRACSGEGSSKELDNFESIPAALGQSLESVKTN